MGLQYCWFQLIHIYQLLGLGGIVRQEDIDEMQMVHLQIVFCLVGCKNDGHQRIITGVVVYVKILSSDLQCSLLLFFLQREFQVRDIDEAKFFRHMVDSWVVENYRNSYLLQQNIDDF